MSAGNIPVSLVLALLLQGAAASAQTAAPLASAEQVPALTQPREDMEQFLRDKGLVAQWAEKVSAQASALGELVVAAMGHLGVPYRRGGNTFENGFDCSGFVKSLYEQTVGLVLPRRAEQQAAVTQQIDKSELQPGDLVFFNTLRRAFSHVGIYVGDGKFIHSPRAGSVVRVEDMNKAYWQNRFDGARRVAAVAQTAAVP
jgi:cell wall-associated NlpC family hydrolase